MSGASGRLVALDPGGARIDPAWLAPWSLLAAHASEPNPFAEAWFVDASLRHLAGQRHLAAPIAPRLLIVEDEGRWLGVLLLDRGEHYAHLPITHSRSAIHYHCLLGTPLVRAGAEALFWRTALETLDSAPDAGAFLHLVDVNDDGPVMAALRGVRRTETVYAAERALLCHGLSAKDYYTTHVRAKKRKELRRQAARLAEQGVLTRREFGEGDCHRAWAQAYLRLEASGWKGTAGTALDCAAETRAFFMALIDGAAEAGRLQWRRIDLDGRPIAMMVNWLCPPGAFTYKIAYDEAYARFSPGVLIEVDNLAILDDGAYAWMDSCAIADHPMIDHLWAGRRRVVRVTVPLAGPGRRMRFSAARGLERLAAWRRARSPVGGARTRTTVGS